MGRPVTGHPVLRYPDRLPRARLAELMPGGPDKAAKLQDLGSELADAGEFMAQITLHEDGTADFERNLPGDPS